MSSQVTIIDGNISNDKLVVGKRLIMKLKKIRFAKFNHFDTLPPEENKRIDRQTINQPTVAVSTIEIAVHKPINEKKKEKKKKNELI